MSRPRRGIGAVLVLVQCAAPLIAGCRTHGGQDSHTVDAAASRQVTVRVPGALLIARGLDTLSVRIDPAAEGETTVRVDAGMVLGVESETRVFERGRPGEASPARHVDTPGAALDAAGATWTTRQDGLPEPGKEYAAEMKLVLFETDVPPAPAWDPRAGGHFHVLLERTLRQAEE